MTARSIRVALVIVLACAGQSVLAKATGKKGAYGAIALQRASGQFGYVYNAATARAAKTEALSQCADARCEVVLSFNNACGVLVRGPNKHYTATGATRQEAETKALRLCAAKDCAVVTWACTK